nr:MAG TPA: hypothetical protein [Caudoviricetes sp.]
MVRIGSSFTLYRVRCLSTGEVNHVVTRPSCLPSAEAIAQYKSAETERLRREVSKLLLKPRPWLQDAVHYHYLSNRQVA